MVDIEVVLVDGHVPSVPVVFERDGVPPARARDMPRGKRQRRRREGRGGRGRVRLNQSL